MAVPKVCVSIVTFNSRRYMDRCLEAVLAQTGVDFEVVIVDNASTDGTRQWLKGVRDRRVRVVYNERNVGFAAAQNQCIALSGSHWVLTLNPDVLLLPGFLRRLSEAGDADSRIGSVCGKLLAIGSDFSPWPEPRIDSAGIYFTPAMRHFDRGWHEPDDGRFNDREYVFGACAAAALYRREMIRDVALADGFFDPDFFAYREDADVAWRAQLLGWRCLYAPEAQAYHVRRVTPGRRFSIPAELNMHSVKNRFLMRVKNLTGGLGRQCGVAATLRDLAVVGGCLLFEQRSLPAFWRIARLLPKALEKRREIMRRRRVSDEEMIRWFRAEPVAEPAPQLALRAH
ncbi:MAG: glycosyltransferase family 2 protein [Bryobacteraceae bacterium]|nr:glycosyltransferase family 2 protein [Bryobacteraceae bacterium]